MTYEGYEALRVDVVDGVGAMQRFLAAGGQTRDGEVLGDLIEELGTA